MNLLVIGSGGREHAPGMEAFPVSGGAAYLVRAWQRRHCHGTLYTDGVLR